MWTLRDENKIMKAKISSKLVKKIIVAQVFGRWENNTYVIGSDIAHTNSNIKLYIWKGDRLTK